MAVFGIEHVNIDTTQPEETIAFYEAVLEVENRPQDRPDFDFPGAWLFQGDQAIIHLNFHEPGSEAAAKFASATKSGSFNHVAFAGSDFAGTCERLDGLGLKYRATERPEIGLKQIFLRDPNNVGIELNIRD